MLNFEWIEKLAKEEISTESTGEYDLYGALDQKKLLETHTIDFLREIKLIAQDLANRFNGYRGDRQSIKIFQISGTVSDFMVFRNHLKLVFSAGEPGNIKVSFIAVRGGMYEEEISKQKEKHADNLIATIGAFNDAIWHFKSHIITTQSLMRYYMTEFIKNSIT